MKRFLLVLLLAGHHYITSGQITTPLIKARFGVDADVRANYFNGLVQASNDDWYNLLVADTSGKAVIDTTGCAAIVAGYLTDVSPFPKRMASMYRTMSRPPFTVVNNRLWLDALFVRDYHGNDTTVFTSGSDKNGMSPFDWTGGIQGIPDKNDILDTYIHIRRAGPNTTDSLFFFGGISLDNTTGNRYFDFEMYQTDIYYDRVSGKWFGYGPDFGHTSWTFDAAGNVLKPGDIIFSAEYQSSTLTKIEARVWVKKTDWQTITPTAWTWSGLFDGANSGATYGYASIQPKTAGAFYSGLGSANNTWAGWFRLILQDNTVAVNYAKDQFMEFAVNLSKLGLDPVTQIGGDICGTPFNRIVIKTRASASFTAELKDFVAPTDLFLAPRVDITTQTPSICDTMSVAQVYITNPIPSSVYQWSTPNGHIIGNTSGTYIWVDMPGIYIVKQYLQAGCSMYASDTIEVYGFEHCIILEKNLIDFRASLNNGIARLDWTLLNNAEAIYFDIERSLDGINFTSVGRINAQPMGGIVNYIYNDPVADPQRDIYYRIRFWKRTGHNEYSEIRKLSLRDPMGKGVIVFPNPANTDVQVQVYIPDNEKILQVKLFDYSGKLVNEFKRSVRKGYNSFTIDDLSKYPRGLYHLVFQAGQQRYNEKLMLIH